MGSIIPIPFLCQWIVECMNFPLDSTNYWPVSFEKKEFQEILTGLKLNQEQCQEVSHYWYSVYQSIILLTSSTILLSLVILIPFPWFCSTLLCYSLQDLPYHQCFS